MILVDGGIIKVFGNIAVTKIKTGSLAREMISAVNKVWDELHVIWRVR